jgi:hypothetical protein
MLFWNWILFWVCEYIYVYCGSVEMLVAMVPLPVKVIRNYTNSVGSQFACLKWQCLTWYKHFIMYFLEHSLYITEKAWFNYEKEQEMFIFEWSHHVTSGYWVVSPGVKWLRCETDHSPLPSAKVRNVRGYIFTPPSAFMVWCLSTGTTLPFMVFWQNPHVSSSSTNCSNKWQLSNVWSSFQNRVGFLLGFEYLHTLIHALPPA